MDLVQQVACSVIPWLQFMADLPEDHPTSKVPIFDLQVWVA